MREAPRLYQRGILIYFVTIVAPACGLLWLGFHSFERQHQALATLAAEQLEADLEALASDCKAYCPLSMSTSTLPAARAQKLVALEAIGDIIL